MYLKMKSNSITGNKKVTLNLQSINKFEVIKKDPESVKSIDKLILIKHKHKQEQMKKMR